MHIEIAKNQDAEAITELTIRSKAYWNYGKSQIEAWRDDLTVSSEYIAQNHVYKLVDQNKLLGFYAFQLKKDKSAKLTFLFIDPDFIGKGYGKVLLLDCLKRAKQMESKSIFLDADPNAQAFYERFGFCQVGQLASSIKDRFLPIMRKNMIEESLPL